MTGTHPSSIYVAAAPDVQARPNMQDDRNALEMLTKMAMRGSGISGMAQLESALVSYHAGDALENAAATVRTLERRGYIRDNKRWITRRGFEAVGSALLRDVMRNLGPDMPGGHHTGFPGAGEITTDTMRPYQTGDDMTNTSVSDTLLNSLRRSRTLPLDVQPSDIMQYVTEADSRTAVVYCLDLSSTMRTRLKDGMSRLEAAKRTLWSLYTLNARYYPEDHVDIVGFASMAYRIRPYDIPYLETFTANEDFLHYTNYQAAFRLAYRILYTRPVRNRRVIMITDGQPSACFVENQTQRRAILQDKPYSRFYMPDPDLLHKVESQRGARMHANDRMSVYLCYKYRGVDDRIDQITAGEARRCHRRGIHTDYVTISDETDLASYVDALAAQTKGRSYWVQDHAGMRVLVSDYMRRTKKTIRPTMSY